MENVLVLSTEHTGICCRSAEEYGSGASKLLLRSKTVNEPASITVYKIRVNCHKLLRNSFKGKT